MNRRRFLSLLGLGLGGIALEQAIPLGRVWSFPKEIAIANAIGANPVSLEGLLNQDIQVYPFGLASASRGLCTVTQVDPLLKTITVNALPAGTSVGDALGLLYNHVDSASGYWNNLARSTYPEVLKTPHVAAGGATITPALRRLGENKLRRVLG